MARITGGGVADMRELAVALKTADPKLKRNLRRRMRAAGRPIVGDVQRSILDMPSRDQTRTLRGEVAGTVGSSIRITAAGIRMDIVSQGSKMPAGMGTLPKHLDAAGGFAHPVFARGSRFTMGPSKAARYRKTPEAQRPQVKVGAWTWTRQHGKTQWFEEPVIRRYRELEAAMRDAMEDTRRELGG